MVKTILIRDDTLAHIKNDLVEISQSNVNSKGLTHVQITLNKNEIIGVCVAMEQNHATSISGHYSRIKKGRFFNAENLPL